MNSSNSLAIVSAFGFGLLIFTWALVWIMVLFFNVTYTNADTTMAHYITLMTLALSSFSLAMSVVLHVKPRN